MSGVEEVAPTSGPSSPRQDTMTGTADTKVQTTEISVFRPLTRHITARDVQLPDSFFEPTAKELSNAIRNYSNNVQNMANAPLKTKKMRDAEEQKRMSRFPKVLIRILLPDRVALQGIFTPQTTIHQLTDFVRGTLIEPDISFYLFVVPPKRKLTDMRSTLWKEQLVPAAIVHLGVEGTITKSAQLIKPEILSKMEDAPEAAGQQDATKQDEKSSDATKPENGNAVEDSSKKKSTKVASKLNKIPKWFKK